MENNINELIEICKKKEYFIRSKTDKSKYKVKIKIEDKYINKYFFINNWDEFLDLYKKFKSIKKDIMIYEVLGNNCKFYIDLQINKLELKDKIIINYIDNKLRIFFKTNFKIDIKIILFKKKKDKNTICRLIIQEYLFSVEDCSYIYDSFLNNINLKSIFCPKKFITYSLIHIPFNILKNINVNMFITNLENSIKIDIYKNEIIKFEDITNMLNIQKIKNSEDRIPKNEEINNKNNDIIKKDEMDIFEYFKNKYNKHNIFKENEIEEGYLYIIIEREFIRMNENIYKIGCTNDIIRRYKQYPKDSKIIYTIIHKKYKEIEKKWLLKLNDNKKLIKRKDIGQEYYEGDYNLIIKELSKIIDIY